MRWRGVFGLCLLALALGGLATAGSVSAHQGTSRRAIAEASSAATVPAGFAGSATSDEREFTLPQAAELDGLVIPDGRPLPQWLLALGVVFAASLLASVGCRVRFRSLIALLSLALLLLLAFETGVHSAHHLGQDAASCAVAWAGSHLGGTAVVPTVVDRPAEIVESWGATLDLAFLPPEFVGSPTSRAPPLPAS